MKKSNRAASKLASAIVRIMPNATLNFDKKHYFWDKNGNLACYTDTIMDDCTLFNGWDYAYLHELDVPSLRLLKRLVEHELKHYTYWKN